MIVRLGSRDNERLSRSFKDGVRETAEISGDGGKTWKPLFDIVFKAYKG